MPEQNVFHLLPEFRPSYNVVRLGSLLFSSIDNIRILSSRTLHVETWYGETT